MANDPSKLAEQAREISALAAEIIARLENDREMPKLERAGRIESIKILRHFAESMRKDLSAGSWPNRDDRKMLMRSIFRGVADMGWYDENKPGDPQVARLLDDAFRLAESYRRLP